MTKQIARNTFSNRSPFLRNRQIYFFTLQNDESPPSDPVPKDDHPPSDPVPKDDTPPSDPVPTDKTPPSDPVPQDDAPPSDPVPKNDPPPPLPMPTGNNKQNIDYTNTDGVHSPEPPDFTVSDYIPTDIGTFERSINFRTTSEDFYNPQRPTPNEGGLFTDYDFTVQKAVPNAGGLEWLRPGVCKCNVHEFCTCILYACLI